MVIEVFLICILVMSLHVSGVPIQRRDARQHNILHVSRASSPFQTLSDWRNELHAFFVRGSPHGFP